MSRPFRNKFDSPRLSPEEAARQGRATNMAFEAFRTAEATMAFLNGHDETLAGRPIDLAVASQDGLAQVERLIAERRAEA
jgi:hypothetical protein